MSPKIFLFFSLQLLIYLTLVEPLHSLGSQEKEETLNISYSVMDMSNPYFQTLVNGCRDRSRQLGHNLIISDATGSMAKQYKQIEQFIESEADIIICSPVNPDVLEPLVEKCRKKGIPFINANQKVDGADAQIIIDEYAFGYAGGEIAGRYIADLLSGIASVLVLTHPVDQIMLEPREQGMIDGISRLSPEADILAVIPAHTPEAGLIETDKMLEKYPDINVIVSLNDAAAIGAYESAIARGWTGPDYCIVGLDATEQAIGKMKRPDSIYRGTVDIDPYGTGKLIVDTALLVYEEGPLEDVISIPMRPITIENLNDY